MSSTELYFSSSTYSCHLSMVIELSVHTGILCYSTHRAMRMGRQGERVAWGSHGRKKRVWNGVGRKGRVQGGVGRKGRVLGGVGR